MLERLVPYGNMSATMKQLYDPRRTIKNDEEHACYAPRLGFFRIGRGAAFKLRAGI